MRDLRIPSTPLRPAALVLATLLGAQACGERLVTGPDDPAINAARAPSGGSGPTVKATDPDTGFRNTTINVQVLGSGFDQGSRAVWALNGDTSFATTKIKTNSTQYVSAKKLIANVTIAADAPLKLFDVVVLTSGGKKGIGLELFAVTYEVIDLGSLGGSETWAVGVNSSGQVVGWGQLPSGAIQAFLWTEAEGVRDLGGFGGQRTQAAAINDDGTVVGTSSSAAVPFRAFRWTAAAGMLALDATTTASSEAFAVNSAGDVGGRSSEAGTGPYPAAVWTKNGILETLSDRWARVLGLNDVDQAVGFSDATGISRPMLWTRTTVGPWQVEELPVGHADAHARDINNAGQVIGYYRNAAGAITGFVWTREGGAEDLPPLRGGSMTDAYAINDAGQVVGMSDLPGGSTAVLWTRTGDGQWQILALPQLGPGRAEARAISENGKIVGWANDDAARHAVLWRLP